MAISFATVGEGSADHVVLENVILGLCKHYKLEPGDITATQPPIDDTGKQLVNSQGGWEQVIQWIKSKQYRDAFQFNDYVVIQIDTDVCDHPNLGVSKVVNSTRNVKALITDVRTKLESLIDPLDMITYEGRFHFAISVHTIECWLVPAWGKPAEAKRVLTCKQRVDNGLARAKMAGLRKDIVKTYDDASACLRNPKCLRHARDHQESLDVFLGSLENACNSKKN